MTRLTCLISTGLQVQVWKANGHKIGTVQFSGDDVSFIFGRVFQKLLYSAAVASVICCASLYRS